MRILEIDPEINWTKEMHENFKDELHRPRKTWILEQNPSDALVVAIRVGHSDVVDRLLHIKGLMSIFRNAAGSPRLWLRLRKEI